MSTLIQSVLVSVVYRVQTAVSISKFHCWVKFRIFFDETRLLRVKFVRIQTNTPEISTDDSTWSISICQYKFLKSLYIVLLKINADSTQALFVSFTNPRHTLYPLLLLTNLDLPFVFARFDWVYRWDAVFCPINQNLLTSNAPYEEKLKRHFRKCLC